MSKHTPGPWNVNHLADDTVRAADGTLVAEVYRNEYEPWNQKLIAAAPELLDRLTEAIELFRFLAPYGIGDTAEEIAEFVNVAQATIRKATGEE